MRSVRLDMRCRIPARLSVCRRGTELHVSLHNALAVTISVHGLGDPTGSGDATVHVAPGAVEQVRFKATTPGLYFYWGSSEVEDVKLRHGIEWYRCGVDWRTGCRSAWRERH